MARRWKNKRAWGGRWRRAKEAKLGNMGGGHEGGNKDEKLRRSREAVPSFTGGRDRKERKSWKSVSLRRSACVLSFFRVSEKKEKQEKKKRVKCSSFKVPQIQKELNYESAAS